MKSEVVFGFRFLIIFVSGCLLTNCAAKDFSQRECVRPESPGVVSLPCKGAYAKTRDGEQRIPLQCKASPLDNTPISFGRFCFRVQGQTDESCCSTVNDLEFCFLTSVYVTKGKKAKDSNIWKVGCRLERVPYGTFKYWQLEIDEDSECDVMCILKGDPIKGSRRDKVDPYSVEASDTVDLASIQFMAPRQLQAVESDTKNEAWLCALTGMSSEVPVNQKDRSGYCKMYVDETKWALGGWSGVAHQKSGPTTLHTSCRGHCVNMPTDSDGVYLQGVLQRDYTKSVKIGVTSGESNLGHCVLSYVNIKWSSTDDESSDSDVKKRGCRLQITDQIWSLDITEAGSVSCGVACVCRTGTNEPMFPQCIPLHSTQLYVGTEDKNRGQETHEKLK